MTKVIELVIILLKKMVMKFEVHGQAACVKPENFDLNVGANYAQIKAGSNRAGFIKFDD